MIDVNSYGIFDRIKYANFNENTNVRYLEN